MASLASSYDVHGLRLSVEAESDELLRCVESILGRFVGNSAGESYKVHIHYGQPPTPETSAEGFSYVWKGQLPDGISLACYSSDDIQRFDLMGLASTRIDLSQRLAVIEVVPGAEWCIGRGCIVLLLCQLLRQAGQHFMHAATLELDSGADPRAILISGSRGFGKTTTSLALANSGLKLMGDDTCFVSKSGDRDSGELSVWGLLLDCKVHHRTMEMMPWLSQFDSIPAVSSDERIVDVRQALGTKSPTRAAPAAIFFLDQRNSNDHQITPLDKVQAVALLSRENLRTPMGGFYTQPKQGFQLFSELAASCDTFQLSVGPQIETLHDRVLNVLAD